MRRPADRGVSGLVVFTEGPEFLASSSEVRELRDVIQTVGSTPTGDPLTVIPTLPDGGTAVEVFEAIASRDIPAVAMVATGWSLVWRLPPGTVVAVRDHVNIAGVTPLVGPADPGARFVHVDGVYRRDLRLAAGSVARRQGWELREGVYARITEPLPPTSAEGRWLRGLGVDLVGNQVVPQSVVAAQVGLGVLALVVVAGWAGVSGPTGVPHEGLKRGRELTGDLLSAVAAAGG